MNAPDEPHVIAEAGGLVVAEQGPLVLVVDRGTGPLATVAFVLSVLALIVGGFGAVVLVARRVAAELPVTVGVVFLVVGLALGAAAITTIGRIRASRNTPLQTYRPVAVFDRARRLFVDRNGVAAAPLDQVRFARRMQATSSSPKLVVVTPSGTWDLKRGNPFTGSIGDLDEVLTAAVHGI